MTRRGRCISVGIGMAIYTAALLLPAVEIEAFSAPHQLPGWGAFWIGAQVTFFTLVKGIGAESKLIPYWLANPALLVAWISLIAGWYRVATVSATLGLVITWIMFWQASDTVAWQPGYWFWSLSMMWIALISLQPALLRTAPEHSSDGGRAAAGSALRKPGTPSA